jgi:hypothetical protein
VRRLPDECRIGRLGRVGRIRLTIVDLLRY